jgi:predicted amidohydrolase
MSRLFGIAGIQMAVVPWDAEATVRKMADAVLHVRRSFPWVRMVLFHELAAPGLAQFVSPADPAAYRRAAQPIPGPLSEQLCAIAREQRLWLVPGSLYEAVGDKLYNTALVISPEGTIVTTYRKMFPWLPYEKGISAGDSFCVFDVPEVGRFGMWFPEVVRSLIWLGAEVILHPTMTPTSDRPLELVMSQANAIFNQCYFIDINGVGPYGGGQSLIVDPDGRVLQQVGSHETILTEILDLDHVTRTRRYGTIGLAQTLKQLRDSGQRFPIYEQGVANGPGFAQLGPLVQHRELKGTEE